MPARVLLRQQSQELWAWPRHLIFADDPAAVLAEIERLLAVTDEHGSNPNLARGVDVGLRRSD